MEAIETVYNGYRFRSRLEARWAVFFDALGIKYEYEPEGYVLEGGIRYLPDFKITITTYKYEHTAWAEVKPKEFTEEERKKCALLVHGTDEDVLLLVGPPDTIYYELISKFASIGIYFEPTKYGFYYGPGIPGEKIEDYSYDEVKKAVDKARQARFEFNETPQR